MHKKSQIKAMFLYLNCIINKIRTVLNPFTWNPKDLFLILSLTKHSDKSRSGWTGWRRSEIHPSPLSHPPSIPCSWCSLLQIFRGVGRARMLLSPRPFARTALMVTTGMDAIFCDVIMLGWVMVLIRWQWWTLIWTFCCWWWSLT